MQNDFDLNEGFKEGMGENKTPRRAAQDDVWLAVDALNPTVKK